ncbi:MAG TPA: ATP-dependent helicase, partial [Firmicutes bacterium]|nr:ATP-dependent helicase [Candidatus Fermentithermobacillaceae bacterium]
IVAGAGAGKTETLTRRIVYLLASGAPPESIVAFTFTEKAAASMKERIYTRVREILGTDVARRLGRMFIGTMHSYAARLLQAHFGYGNYDVLDENQEVAFILQNGWGLGFGKSLEKHGKRYGEYCLDFLKSQNVVCDELLTLDEVRSGGNTRFADEVERYWDLLERSQLLTFSRMIRLAAENLRRTKPDIGVRHLIVDEYQDINRAQEALIDAIIACGGASCMVVGDPRQCIYEWRGSDPGCFSRFRCCEAESIDLLENWRSLSSIVRTANTLARYFEDAELRKPMKSLRTESGLAVLVEHGSPEAEAEWIARQVLRAREGGLRLSDISILLRSVSTSGQVFAETFDRYGIPYLVGGKIGLFRRPEADALASIWMWLGGHERYIDYGILIPHSALLDHAQKRWPGGFNKKYVIEFRARLLSGKYGNFIDAYYDLLSRLGCMQWKPNEETFVRMANLGRFSQVLLDFESALWRGGRRMKWETQLDRLAWYITTYAQTGYGEERSDDLPDVDAVTISTVHQAKGLEWPVVFVPALTDQRFPSRRTGQKQEWLLSRDLFDAERYEGNKESERRLFYVAITRARDVLVLSRFLAIRRPTRPSPFLSEVGTLPLHHGALDLAGAASSKTGTDEELMNLSIQEILAYLRCPHEYRLRHVWGYEPELVRQLGFGRSVHYILRVLADYAKRGVDPASVVSQVVNSHFFLPYETKEAIDKIKPAVENLLRRFLAEHGHTLNRVEEAEAHVEFFLDRHATLSGRVDVIVTDGDALEVVDYKTADDVCVDDEVELQLQLYALGLCESGREVACAKVIHVLDEGAPTREVPVSKEALERARRVAHVCLSGIIKREFPAAKDGQKCKRCDVKKVCWWG